MVAFLEPGLKTLDLYKMPMPIKIEFESLTIWIIYVLHVLGQTQSSIGRLTSYTLRLRPDA